MKNAKTWLIVLGVVVLLSMYMGEKAKKTGPAYVPDPNGLVGWWTFDDTIAGEYTVTENTIGDIDLYQVQGDGLGPEYEWYLAQTFTISGTEPVEIDKVKMKLSKYGDSPQANLHIGIYGLDGTGKPDLSNLYMHQTFPTTFIFTMGTWIETGSLLADISTTLEPGTYALAVQTFDPDATPIYPANAVVWYLGEDDPYAGGEVFTMNGAPEQSGIWQAFPNGDFTFELIAPPGELIFQDSIGGLTATPGNPTYVTAAPGHIGVGSVQLTSDDGSYLQFPHIDGIGADAPGLTATPTPFTIMMFTKVDWTDTAAHTLFAKRDPAYGRVWLKATATDQILGSVFLQAAGALMDNSFSDYVGEWVHLALVSEGLGGNAVLYIDGVPEPSVPVPATVVLSGGDFVLGAAHGGGTRWDGAIDELLIYDRALTQGEIQEYLFGSADENSLVSHWLLDTDGTDVFGRNDGEVKKVEFVSGLLGSGAAYFDNEPTANEAIQIPDSSSLKPDSYTISSWVYFDNFKEGAPNWIFTKYLLSSNKGYGLFVRRPPPDYIEQYATTFIGSGDTAEEPYIHCDNLDTIMQIGKWYHLASSYDASNQTVKTYVNGVPAVCKAEPIEHMDKVVEIGSHINYDQTYANNTAIHGKIDDVKFYNYALSDSEVSALYSSGLPSAPSGGGGGGGLSTMDCWYPDYDMGECIMHKVSIYEGCPTGEYDTKAACIVALASQPPEQVVKEPVDSSAVVLLILAVIFIYGYRSYKRR